jgi:ribosomal protein S18 acetylase RimI-like enzyme
MDINKLDNPVWHSLNETHSNFALEYDDFKFYHPDFCPFGGFTSLINSNKNIEAYTSLVTNFYVVGDKPNFNNTVLLNKDLICNQMVLNKPIELDISEQITKLKTERHLNELFELVNLVQPGYFKNKTHELGSYYGIIENDKLIAVTGERMKMNNFTEISAVITHPNHTGKGYAKQLIKHTSDLIFKDNKTPYLHVANSNTNAIKLYNKLGFQTRRTISFWNLISNH